MSDVDLNNAIDWPKWWRGEGRHFLEGMPFFGTHCKIIKYVRLRLEERDLSSFEKAWNDVGYSTEQCNFIVWKVGEIVDSYISWPNHFFFPEDRTALLFGVIPGVWFDAEDPVEEVRNEFHVKGVRDGDIRYYDVVLKGTFKECVDLLVEGLEGDKIKNE